MSYGRRAYDSGVGRETFVGQRKGDTSWLDDEIGFVWNLKYFLQRKINIVRLIFVEDEKTKYNKLMIFK